MRNVRSLRIYIGIYQSLLILLFAGLIVMSTFSYGRKVRKDYIENSRSILSSQKERLSVDLDGMGKSVDTVFANSIHYRNLVTPSRGEYSWYKALYGLKDSLKVKAESIDFTGGMFYYSASKDSLCTLLSGETDSGSYNRMREAFRHYLNQTSDNMRGSGHFLYEGESWYAAWIYQKGHYLGYLVNLSRYFKPSDNEMYILADNNDQIITVSSGRKILTEEQIQEIGLNSAEDSISMIHGYSVGSRHVPVLNMNLILVRDPGNLFQFWNWPDFWLVLFLVPAVGVIWLFLLYKLLRQILVQPVLHIMEHLARIREDGRQQDNSEISSYCSKDHYEISEHSKTQVIEFREINRQIDELLTQIQTLEEEKYLEKLRVNSALLQYYQLQVNPHFFINCLNNIRSLLETNSRNAADEMIHALSSHFRYVFQDNHHIVTVQEEIREIQEYTSIYSIKGNFPILLDIKADEDTMKVEIPVLTMQTFVENSIRYAIKEGGVLKIQIRCEFTQNDNERKGLRIYITDNGKGYTPDILEKCNAPITEYTYPSDHVGILNLRYRLKLFYEERAEVYFFNVPYGGAAVEMVLWEKDPEENGL